MNKKRLISLSILLLAFASSNAQAWWFFFLPGSVTGAIADAVTGSEGANCVSSAASVGDRVRLPDGSIGMVQSLSGKSSRCTNPALPVRALIVPQSEYNPAYKPNASTASDSQPCQPSMFYDPTTDSDPCTAPSYSSAPSSRSAPDQKTNLDSPEQSTKNGSIPRGLGFNSSVSIELPSGWEPQPLTDKLKDNGYFVYARNQSIDAGLLVSAAKRESSIVMQHFVEARRLYQKIALLDATVSETEQLQINGMPAWHFVVSGKTSEDVVSRTYSITLVEGENEIIEIKVWTFTGWYSVQNQDVRKIAAGLRGLSASSAPVYITRPEPVTPSPEAPATTSTAAAPEPEGSIETRLGVLNKLYKDGLISEKDFESKKREILKGL